jgi:hypothetical protein
MSVRDRMRPETPPTHRPSATSAGRETTRAWQRPAFDVVCLACEISAYAPDEGEPLF